MMRSRLKGKFAKALAFCMVIATLGGYIAMGAGAGSSDDPLISLSYIEGVLWPKILKEIDERLDGLSEGGGGPVFGGNEGSAPSGAAAFKSIQVFAGQTITGDEGSEMILRIGSATAVCPGENGLVDATDGLDLKNGGSVLKNHVYIIPRDDGRGIKMLDDGYMMIKGGYKTAP